MDTTEARRIIESLRYGVPPDGYVCELTVGRRDEIDALRDKLNRNQMSALLLNANYGAGKTHLLRFIREDALSKGWMVSLVSLDSRSGVRFDLLSQIVGAICRNIELPDRREKGIRSLLDAFKDRVNNNEIDPEYWNTLHSNGKWDRKQHFESEPLFLGLRAWLFCDHGIEDYIENWFQSPHKNSDVKATYIYKTLIEGMRIYYRDARPKTYFSPERVDLSRNGDLCWAFLRDLNRAAQAIGLRGMVICCDEFEDIIYNSTGLTQKKMAFCNLFELFYGHQYRAQAYFAVTPGFVQKCKHELARNGVYDYDYSQFDGLPQFAMSPIDKSHLQALSRKIVRIHTCAFDWDPKDGILSSIANIVGKASRDPSQDRVRQCIRQIVSILDRSMDV